MTRECPVFCLALAVMVCSLVVLRGNLLVFTPVLGVWSFTVFASPRVDALRQRTRAGRQKGKVFRRDFVSKTSLVSVSIALWCLCALIAWRRIHDVPSAAPPKDAAVAEQIAKAERLFQSGQCENALSAFKTMEIPRTLPRRCAQKHHNIGVLGMRLERWDEAEQAFRTALEYDSTGSDAHYNLAWLSLRKKNIPEAKQHLAQALIIKSNHPGAHYLLAQCHIQAGDQAQAFTELESADAVTPADHPLKPTIRNLKEQIRRRVSVSR